ncbi:MAG: adenylyltransferase/cytidyltransferase family protein [Lachnospiraceae bacterium]|nr:adenylyltransferase/cytidyltransferase family protein [Lachnospiraceae bacterium]
MTRVITYGTYDMLHYGHIRLLERAKSLGDYLIVGVTSDDFDKARGKINVQQSLMERVEAVRITGIADEIIIEEYEGQKIEDIRRLDIDIFTVGSDWEGHFDYLKEYCKVIYLSRTHGVSSTAIRSSRRVLTMGLVGDKIDFLTRFLNESKFVNGLHVCGICSNQKNTLPESLRTLSVVTDEYDCLLEHVDSVYLISSPVNHYEQIRKALEKGIHVLCESPIVTDPVQYDELLRIAKENNCILSEAIRTAYSTAYSRLLLMLKSGKIGKVVSVDATCTAIRDIADDAEAKWNSINEWGPTAMLPVFQILGCKYVTKQIVSNIVNEKLKWDAFTKIDFVYADAVASIKVGKGVKSEGELIVSGTEGYIYVPAPWWKTDYFEVRYENSVNNQRYFYQLDGEGIRYELVAFSKAVETGQDAGYISAGVSREFSRILNDYENGRITLIC